MAKRPSLAETMRQVATSPEPQVISLRPEPQPVATEAPALSPTSSAKPFFAATRAGKKKVTAALAPAAHKQLKSLAVDHETTTEALLAEAIADLFTKYGRPSNP